MAIKLQYLVDPLLGFQTKNGSLNTAGIINVYDAATDDPAVTYKDFVGTRNAQDIRLDDNGRAVIIADDSRAYRVEVRDQFGALLYNQSPMYAKGGGGGSVGGIDIISSDETVNIEASSEGGVKTFDLSVDKDDPEYVVCDSYYVMGSGSTGSGSGYIVPQNMSEGNMTVDSRGILLIGGHHYHIDAWLTVTADPDSANPSNEYRQREMTLNFRLAADGTPVDMVFDNSFAHSDSFTLSGDLHPTSDIYLKIYFDNYEWADYSSGSMPSAHISMPRIDVHSIVGSYNGTGGTGGSLPPATPADEGKVLTVDEDGLPEWRSLGEDSSYAIANGSIVFTSGQYYTDGVVTLSNIRSNGIEYAYNNDGWVLEKDHTYVIAYNIVASVGYAEAGRVGGRIWLDGFQETDQVWKFSIDTSATHDESLAGTAIVCPQSTSEVHLNIRYDSNSLEHIPSASVNKAEIVDVTARVSGGGGGDTPQYRPGTGIDIDDDVISIDPTETQEKLTAGVNIDIDSDNIISTGKTVVAAGSNVSVTSAYDGLTKTTTYTVSSQQGGQQVQSDWTEEDASEASYIQHKPNTKPIQAGTGISVVEYADNIRISGTINAQVQSDWAEADSSDMSYVKNKPSTKQIVAGSNITITDSQGAITISSAGAGGLPIQADWSQQDSTQLDYIKNKPTIPDAQVQSNWTESNASSKSFILNKPTTKSIVAGTGISITETATEIIISLA